MTITSTLTASDGVTLAVHRYTDIDAARPTILAIHGFPDNHHVWDGVAHELTSKPYNVVAYDVRGAGESTRPAKRSGYLFAQLVSDIGAVIDSLGVGRVHLLAHDWGSIQAWAAVTDESVMGKIASFTSISGPHLNYAGAFLRSARTPRAMAQVIRQLIASGYIGFFLCPGVPELSFRSRIGVKVMTPCARSPTMSTGSTCTGRTCRRRCWRRDASFPRPRSPSRLWCRAATSSSRPPSNGSPEQFRWAAG
jgi:pimeloyl-ACP methyl ester carboxylesterase